MNHKKVIALTVVTILFAGASISFAYAASDGFSAQDAQAAGLALAAFLVGGIEWSIGGYVKALRAHNDIVKKTGKDPDWKGFQLNRLKDDVLVGLFIGVFVFMMTAVSNVPQITDVATFIVAVQFAVGIIAPFDQFFVGGVLKR